MTTRSPVRHYRRHYGDRTGHPPVALILGVAVPEKCHSSGSPRARTNGHASASPWVLAATTHGLCISVTIAAEAIAAEPDAAEDSVRDIVQEWGEHSFPASDPPANW